jgi:hypothetical protein
LLCIAICLYYYSSNCRAQVASHGNSVQLMFIAIGERPELQGWALKAPNSRGARQLMVNHLYFVLQTDVALGRLSTKQFVGQDVATSSGESNGSSGA